MKSFFKTIAGKTILFILSSVSICALAASILLAAFMISEDFYTQDKEKAYENIVYGKLHYGVSQNVWGAVSAYDKKVVTLDGDGEIACKVFDKDEKLIGETEGAENVSDWKYTFAYGVTKYADGSLADVFHTGLAADENVDYYTVKVALIGDSSAVNFYTFTRAIVDKTYGLKYWIYVIVFLLALVVIASFVALMWAAGRRNEDDLIHPGPLYRVPFDVLLGVFIGALVFWALLMDSFHYDDIVLIALACSGLVLMVCLLVGLAMSLAVRIKERNLIKGSLIYIILRQVLRLLKFLGRGILQALKAIASGIAKIPLVWKTVLAIAIVCIYELIFFSVRHMWGPAWIVEKILMIPAVIYIALMLRTLQKGGLALASGNLANTIDTKRMILDFKKHGENLNSVGKGMTLAVNEQLKSERMKTELITNVSHDIKTPLTSIINYADLISKEETENETIHEYTDVLLRQSERLKRLIDDLVEASKASTGNLDVSLFPCDAATFVNQATGEYQDKLRESNLALITSVPAEEIRILADGRRMWRIFDNLMNNICKYAQPNTRVYLSLEEQGGNAVFTFKNTSKEQLNISEEELMERFTRGDSSRNTDGNGLGLSIAKSMAALQNGDLKLSIDGDLFKAILTFPKA